MKKSKPRRFPKCPADSIEDVVYLHPGEYFFATKPTLIHTVLGSCVSVALFDPVTRYGALCHGMFPAAPKEGKNIQCSKYMDCIIDVMMSDFGEHKVPLHTLIAKVFGGSKMFDQFNPSAQALPGQKNIDMSRKILAEYQCSIAAEDCGGSSGRRIYFCSHTGDVFLRRISKV